MPLTFHNKPYTCQIYNMLKIININKRKIVQIFHDKCAPIMLYNEYIWTIPMFYISIDIQFSISNFLFKIFYRDSWIFDIYMIEKQTYIWKLYYKNLNQNTVLDFWMAISWPYFQIYILVGHFFPLLICMFKRWIVGLLLIIWI
jgi:hypothetical protein